jgi:hypothetical protein
MANTEEVEWRYYELKGEATIVKLGESTLVFLKDLSVNPRQEVLRFGSELKVISKSGMTPIDLPSGELVNRNVDGVTVKFDKAWFDHTMRNGFKLSKSVDNVLIPVTSFDQLDKPDTHDNPDDMNPIVPSFADTVLKEELKKLGETIANSLAALGA